MARFLDRLFGKPDIERFAAVIKVRLEAIGLGPLTYHAEQRELRSEGARHDFFFLGNVYSDYVAATKAKRPAVIDRFISGARAHGQELPSDYSAVRRRLLPIVRRASDDVVTSLRRSSAATAVAVAEVDSRLAIRPLAGDVTVGLAYDSADSIMRLPEKKLATWGVSFEEALKDALDNLRALPEHGGWVEISEGVWSGQWGDDYDTSRILLPDLIHRLGIPEPVACIPLRSTLYVTSARNARGLAELAARVRTALETQPRWLSARPLQLVDGTWSVFAPQPDIPELALIALAFRNVAAIADTGLYADQKTQLDEIHKRDQVDVFVASATLFENAAGALRSDATWTKGVEALLPKTDLIAFTQIEPGTKGVLLVTWTSAEAIVGARMHRTHDMPARYAVRSFPDAAELDQLREVVTKL